MSRLSHSRAHRTWTVFSHRFLAPIVVLVLATSLVGAIPPPVAAAATNYLTPPPKTVLIPHKNAPVKKVAPYRPPASAVPTATSWPAAGDADVTLSATVSAQQNRSAKSSTDSTPATKAGSLPILLGNAVVPAAGQTPRSTESPQSPPSNSVDVHVHVADQSAAHKAGVDGVLFSVAPSTPGTNDTVSVGLAYSAFRDAVGADWASRLHLVELPACALTTPNVRSCDQQTPVPGSTNDAKASVVSANVALVSSARSGKTDGEAAPQNGNSTMVLAAVAAAGGPNGTFQVSSLKPSGSWSVSGASGDFSWSYPIAVPPASAGNLAPSVALSYDSQSVDGETAGTNTQPSWIGDGWDYQPGYIERTYRGCSDDTTLPANEQTGDECWGGQDITMSLNGGSTQLVDDDADKDKNWHTQSDTGDQVAHLYGAANGALNGEYWEITTTDGTHYFFGRESGPGYTNQGVTNSTWTVPVYGPHAGDPCNNAAGFTQSVCTQAYRWNLDYVEDTHGNVAMYYYAPETNYYTPDISQTTGDRNANPVSYVRGGTLARIDYGLRDANNTVYASPAPDQVVFNTAQRCDSTKYNCDPSQFTAANASHWPDTPQDQQCVAKSLCANYSPSFWSMLRLTNITTQYANGSGGYTKVDSYDLAEHFPGDSGDNALLLDSIVRTGFAADGTSITMPPVSFQEHLRDNRVDGYASQQGMARYRIDLITAETGQETRIVYSDPDCTATDVPADASNDTRLCYPVIWTQPGASQETHDYFHKYTTKEVDVIDPSAAAPTQITTYAYQGDPAWHFDDNEMTKPADRTYDQFRGYAEVDVSSGNTQVNSNGAPDQQTLTKTSYFRGMDGDTLPGGKTASVSVKNSLNETVPDNNLFADNPYEVQTYNGINGLPLSDEITNLEVVATTASRARTGLSPLTANIVSTAKVRGFTDLAAGGQQTSTTSYTYDSLGRTVQETDSAQGLPDMCTTNTYAGNLTTGVRDKIDESIVSQEACVAGAQPTPKLILSDNQTYYDGSSTLGTVTNGDVTRGDSATVNANGQLTFATTSTATFDASGRPLSTTDYDDADNDKKVANTTTLAYTPADGGNLTQTVTTNPKGQTSSLTVDPGRNLTTHAVDVASHATDATYDPLGRLTAVWLPGHNKDRNDPASSTYSYLLQPSGVQAVTTKTLVDRGVPAPGDNGPQLNYTTSIQLYNAFGQLRQTQSDAEGGGRVVSDTFYDSHGWVIDTNNHYATDGAPSTTVIDVDPSEVNSRTLTAYDGAGRAVKATNYNGDIETDSSQTIYGGDRTTTIPPQGGVSETVLDDARGHATEMRQYTAPPTVTGSVVAGGTYNSTTYGYTALGQQNKITDADGNVWTSSYDMLGRQAQANDPSTGQSNYTYDLAGNLLTSTDARGQTLAYTYDALNRKTAEYSGSTSGTELASWTYDLSQPGKLYESSRYDAQGDAFTSGVYSYDTQGNPNWVFTTVPDSVSGLAGEYDTTYSYTSTNLVSNVEPADGGGLPSEDIANSYDPLGNEVSSHGSNQYLGGASYTPYGEPQQYLFGPSPTGVASLNFGYDDQTRRISDVIFNANQANPQLDDSKYSYDPAGNLTRTTDVQGAPGAPTQTTCDSYDALDRLSAAWTATDNCANPPTTAAGKSNIGGTDPYWESWQIDPTGLRQQQVQHALPGATGGDITTTYTYPGAGQSQRDSLSSTSTTGPTGTASTSYGYDADGNTTTRTLPTGPQTLTWDAENHLATDKTGTGTSSYTYDADGNELMVQDPGSTTLYLPGEELTYSNTTKAVTGTRYYSVNGQTVAVRTGKTDPDYLDGDQHGTMQTVYDPTKKTVTRRTFDPYGNQVGQDMATSSTGTTSPGSWPDQHGFLNDPVDSSNGLTDIGARQYDTTTGRFVSVDPDLNPADPQSMNGYAYADDDPVSNSDPTGLRPACDGDVSCAQGYESAVTSAPAAAASRHAAELKDADWAAEDAAVAKVGSGKVAAANTTLHTSIIDVILRVGGDFLKGLLGIDDIENCFGHGAVGSCVSLLLSVLPFDRILEEGVNLVKFVVRAVDAVRDFVKETEAAEHVMEEVSDAEQAIQDADEAVQAADDTAASAADDAGGGGGEGSDDASGSSDSPAEDSGGGGSEGASCNSFAGATQVLMADGTTKAIDQVKVGDKVSNAEPDSSIVQQHTVTAVHVTYIDRDFDDLTVSTSTGSGTITVTAAHLVWDITTQQWTEAGDLKIGDQLDTPGDGRATITASRHYTTSITTYNLTVDHVHTYYVFVGVATILVHNCGDGGKYGQLQPAGPGNEINHMPQQAATSLSKYSGPAIRMERADHRALYSTGSSLASRAWRKMQTELVNNGQIDQAMENDINDVKSRFPGKYDSAIQEMLDSLPDNAAYQALRGLK